jgi:hypothetical protein
LLELASGAGMEEIAQRPGVFRRAERVGGGQFRAVEKKNVGQIRGVLHFANKHIHMAILPFSTQRFIVALGQAAPCPSHAKPD